jgi:hypothetical protein
VKFVGGSIVGVAELEKDVAPGPRAAVGRGAVDGEVIKDERVAGFRGTRDTLFDRIVLRREIESSGITGQRPEFVGAGIDDDASVFLVGVVEVNTDGEHGVLLVGEVGVVLVHGEPAAFLRGFGEELGVVELDVGSDEEFDGIEEGFVEEELGEESGLELHVVDGVEALLLSFFVADPGSLPESVGLEVGGVHALEAGVGFVAHAFHGGGVEHVFDQQVAVLPVELGLFL